MILGLGLGPHDHDDAAWMVQACNARPRLPNLHGRWRLCTSTCFGSNAALQTFLKIHFGLGNMQNEDHPR